MKPKQKYYEVTAKEIIKNFKKRNIEGYYCSNSEAAANKVMELISENSTVAWGGSMTRGEIGLLEKLQKADLELLDRTKAQNSKEKNEIDRKAFYSDYYLMSSNAITQDGKLVNIDGNGNRVAALCFGPKNVIIIAGMNKVTRDEDSARKRVRNLAAPMNAIRLDQKTPCAETGSCHQCLVEDCICGQILITRKSGAEGRIKVILVGEELGF